MRVNSYQQQRRPSLIETGQSKSSNNKYVAKRKSRWKLKFHHQTLPAEYQHRNSTKLQLDAKLRMAPPPPPPPLAVAACPRHATRSARLAPRATGVGSRALAQFAELPPTPTKTKGASSASGPPSTVRYADLPFMGEMTLDNAVPRRGRKPKKADICRLIYKNYGTTVVDEPLNLCVRDARPENDGPTRAAAAAAAVSPAAGGGDGDGGRAPDAAGSIRDFGLAADADADADADATSALRRKKRADAAALPRDSPTFVARVSKKKSRLLRGRQLARKNRKSMAREKLERTFEERGFLIQTQQLESAQGATYCKFRQLRKFTRYLFRSWKHHLPGDVLDKQ